MNYRSMSHKQLLPFIEKVKEKVKSSQTYKDLCEEYGVEEDFIDDVPMAFADLDVSARTDKGCIYFNFKLLEDGDFESEDHYMAHEICHFLQQIQGDGPTQGSTDDTYLDNEFEQEGFQYQTKYLSETRGEQAAKEYISQVLDHHDVDNEKERKKRTKDLLELIR